MAPYTYGKVGSRYAIFHKGTHKKAVKKTYSSRSEAERVGNLRMRHEHIRK